MDTTPSNPNRLQWSNKTSPLGNVSTRRMKGTPRLDAQSTEIELALDQRQAAQVNAREERKMDGQDNACQNSLQQLFTMSPTPVYSIEKS